MRRRHAIVALLASAIALPAMRPVQAETILHLGETATVMASPDEMAAALRAEAVNASAAEAQNRVNTVIQDALARARQVAGITVSTGNYSVWRAGPTQQDRTERWQASQTIRLTGRDGPKLLTLVGELQQKGLVVGELGWRVSREAHRTAHHEATKLALGALRGRVEEAAELLGLRFDHFKEVRLDTAAPTPMFRSAPAPMAMATSAMAPPPTAQAEDQPIGATAEADAVLVPR